MGEMPTPYTTLTLSPSLTPVLNLTLTLTLSLTLSLTLTLTLTLALSLTLTLTLTLLTLTPGEMHTPYIVPSESGTRGNVRWLALSQEAATAMPAGEWGSSAKAAVGGPSTHAAEGALGRAEGGEGGEGGEG